MSIKGYLTNLINGNTGTPSNLKFGEYVVKLGAKRKDGKVITRQVPFGISGPSAATISQLDEAAVIMAGRIAKLSEGVEFGIYKKLGKYRNDETPTTLACKATQWGSVIMSNDPRVEDPDAVGPYPLQAKSDKLFVPWLDDETSRQDMKLTVKAPIPVGGNNFYLATSRFVDSQKTAIEVFPLSFVQGVQTKCYNTVANFDLVNDDTDEVFGTDGTASEKFTPVVSGSDDQGS